MLSLTTATCAIAWTGTLRVQQTSQAFQYISKSMERRWTKTRVCAYDMGVKWGWIRSTVFHLHARSGATVWNPGQSWPLAAVTRNYTAAALLATWLALMWSRDDWLHFLLQTHDSTAKHGPSLSLTTSAGLISHQMIHSILQTFSHGDQQRCGGDAELSPRRLRTLDWVFFFFFFIYSGWNVAADLWPWHGRLLARKVCLKRKKQHLTPRGGGVKKQELSPKRINK